MGGSFLMSEAWPGVRSYMGRLRVAGARAVGLRGGGGRAVSSKTWLGREKRCERQEKTIAVDAAQGEEGLEHGIGSRRRLTQPARAFIHTVPVGSRWSAAHSSLNQTMTCHFIIHPHSPTWIMVVSSLAALSRRAAAAAGA
jgi:hypothetical protein